MDQLPSWISIGIATVVAFMGFLQWRTARQQWRTANNRAVFDQFQRRYEVYQEFRDIASMVTLKMIVKAADAAERARFLFGDDVVAHLAQLTNDVRDLQICVSEFDSLQGGERQNNLDEQRRLKDKIEEFRTRAPTVLASYMRFEHKIT